MEREIRKGSFTADELLRLPHGMGEEYELIEGELVVREPPGIYHGAISGNLSLLLGKYNQEHRLGRVLVGNPGFFTRGNDRTVRAPDVAFLSYERLPPGDLTDGYGDVSPELVVEILSPSDRPGEVAAKSREWLAFGVEEVWEVDPRRRRVKVVTRERTTLLGEGATLESARALPGFEAPVAALFAD